MERMWQYLPYLLLLRIWVLLTALFLTRNRIPYQYDGGENQPNVCTSCEVAATHTERIQVCVQTLSQTVALYDAKITNIEEMVSSLAAHVTTLETNATSVSSGSGSASTWNLFGHGDGSLATGSPRVFLTTT